MVELDKDEKCYRIPDIVANGFFFGAFKKYDPSTKVLPYKVNAVWT